VEERWREMAGIEMEGEEAGRRKRGGERGCDNVLLSPEVPLVISQRWRGI